jgi:6-pyruvoyl-tetrahydropterin synthase
MVTKAIKSTDEDVDHLVLNWEKGSPLQELFEKEPTDENLLIQLTDALKRIYLMDSELDSDPQLASNKEFRENLKKALHDLGILIPPYEVCFVKEVSGYQYHVEISLCNHKTENPHVIKDITAYLKKKK